MTTTITEKNQVTLPAELVREPGWGAGTRLDWRKLDDGRLVANALPSRGEIVRRVMGLARAKPGTDPVAALQRIQEEEDSSSASADEAGTFAGAGGEDLRGDAGGGAVGLVQG